MQLTKQESHPIDQPENVDFDLDEMGKDKPFTFKATVQVKPEVKLGEYKGLEVEELRYNCY